MAIVTPSPRVESTPSPQASSPSPQAPRRLTGRRGLLTWVGVLAGLAAAVALAVAAVTGDADNSAPVHRGHTGPAATSSPHDSGPVNPWEAGNAAAERELADHGSIRSIEGSVEDEIAVNPNGAGARASEDSVDGAGD